MAQAAIPKQTPIQTQILVYTESLKNMIILVNSFSNSCISKIRRHVEASSSHCILMEGETRLGWHGGATASIAATQLYGPCFDFELQLLTVGCFCKFSLCGLFWGLWFPPFLQKHASLCIGIAKFVPRCMHGVLLWTGIPSSVRSHLTRRE